MKRHWVYAAIAFCAVMVGSVLFVSGFAIGISMRPAAAEPQEPTGEEVGRAVLQKAVTVLKRPWARKLFDAAARDGSAELSVVRLPNSVRITSSGNVLVSSSSPEDLASALEGLEGLQEAGLMAGSRRVERGTGETKIYALTTFGHAMAKKLAEFE